MKSRNLANRATSGCSRHGPRYNPEHRLTRPDVYEGGSAVGVLEYPAHIGGRVGRELPVMVRVPTQGDQLQLRVASDPMLFAALKALHKRELISFGVLQPLEPPP
jgi:hypothetical protein